MTTAPCCRFSATTGGTTVSICSLTASQNSREQTLVICAVGGDAVPLLLCFWMTSVMKQNIELFLCHIVHFVFVCFYSFFCISSGYRSLCSQESYLNMNMFNYLFFWHTFYSFHPCFQSVFCLTVSTVCFSFLIRSEDKPNVTFYMSRLSNLYSESVKKLRSSHFSKSLHITIHPPYCRRHKPSLFLGSIFPDFDSIASFTLKLLI